jgi:uncharacterized membrane protein YesL
MESRSRQYGDGALFRFSNTVYWFLATEFYLVVTGLPFVFALVFLERDPSNAVLYAIAGAFLGPAIAAALHCMRKIMREKDLDPTRDFVRGYRLNVLDTLKFWVPAVAVLTILVLNLRSLETQSSPLDAALQVLMVLVALIGTLWLMNMMVISTAFHFRQRDLARLSVFYLGKTLRITFGNLATLFIAAVLLLLTSDWVLLLSSSLFVYLFALNTADLVVQVEARFTGASPTQNRSE